MAGLWYAIVSGMLAVYVILDGFDFGAGILHRSSPGPKRSGTRYWPPSSRSGTATNRG